MDKTEIQIQPIPVPENGTRAKSYFRINGVQDGITVEGVKELVQERLEFAGATAAFCGAISTNSYELGPITIDTHTSHEGIIEGSLNWSINDSSGNPMSPEDVNRLLQELFTEDSDMGWIILKIRFPPSPSDIWFILDHMRKTERINPVTKGWISQGEWNDLSHTVNSINGSGIASRHGYTDPNPRGRVISVVNYQRLFMEIISRWLEEKVYSVLGRTIVVNNNPNTTTTEIRNTIGVRESEQGKTRYLFLHS